MAERIKFTDRLFLTGITGSGKSMLARALFLGVPAPRMILDPVDSDVTRIPGAVTFCDVRRATNAAGENWRQAATARFVPNDPDDLAAYSDVYRWIYANGKRYVWCDEGGLILPSSGGNPGGRKILVAGRKVPIGHMACHTRPRHIDRDAVAQAQHVFMFATPGVLDRRYLADNMGLDRDLLEHEHAQLPEHGFLWWDQRARHLTVCSPLRL